MGCSLLTKVLSKRKKAPIQFKVTKDSVLVDRTTVWGNPFRYGTREENISDFVNYANQRLKKEHDWLKPLIGKDLVCWCAPDSCHADEILKLIDKIYGQ